MCTFICFEISCSGEGCHIATLGAGVNIIVFQAAECDIIRVHHSINLHLQFTLYYISIAIGLHANICT